MKHPLQLPIAALALAGLCISAYGAETKKPNILVIVADDLGYGELSTQGFTTEIPTPNVDSLAKNGIRFTSGYVSGPYCSPTRAGLLTGKYQQRFGHEFNPGPAQTAGEKVGLSLAEKTLGDRLKTAGYATGWFGKSHLGYEPEFNPTKRGFDEYFGFLGGAHDYLDAAGDKGNPILRGTEKVNNIDYTTDAFGREAVSFIDKHKAEPWLVYLPFNAVHAPLESIDKYLARFSNIEDKKRRTFAAMLSALDDAVGSVLAKVREIGQEENTLIFFISDNGGPTPSTTSQNGPLHGFKAQTWEGGIRVPWIVQWKGHIPAGKVDERPVIQLDILPTALAAAGVEVQPDWKVEGVNLLPYLSGGKTEAPHDALYWRFGQQIAIRKGDWKLVKAVAGGGAEGGPGGVATTKGAQLYNLAQDLGEKTNLADKEPAKVQELAAQWDEWNKSNIPAKWLPGKGGKAARGKGADLADDNDPKPAAATTAAAAPKTSAQGPWKSGDTLGKDQAPQIANHGLDIAAQIEATSPNGVIVAQGAQGNGYALFLKDGKLALAIRAKKQLTTVLGDKPLAPGSHKVEAKLTSAGDVTLFVDGQPAGEGKAGTIGNQPQEGLTIGTDGKGAVGDYTAPNDFAGKVENVTVQTL